MIGLFERCYERRQGFTAASWQLVALPAPGAMDQQDAWTMQALDFVRDLKNSHEYELAEVTRGR